MIRCILAVCVLLGSSTIRAQQWPSLGRDIARMGGGENDAAVVVGIADYAFLPDVPGATANADDWGSHLVRSRGVAADRVIILKDAEATRERIIRAVKSVASSRTRDGKVWFIFIGHGAPAPDGHDGVLLGVDTQPDLDSLGSRGVLQGDIKELVGANAILVFDAIFSGRTADGSKPLVTGMQATVPVRRSEPSTAIIFSASPTFAGPLPKTNRPAFSYILLGSLRGWADEDGNRSVTFAEALSFSRRTLKAVFESDDRLPTGQSPTPTIVLQSQAAESPPDVDAILLGHCPVASVWRGRFCEEVICPEGSDWNGAQCAANAVAIACPTGTSWDGTRCLALNVSCPRGTQWDGKGCAVGVSSTIGGKKTIDPVARPAWTQLANQSSSPFEKLEEAFRVFLDVPPPRSAQDMDWLRKKKREYDRTARIIQKEIEKAESDDELLQTAIRCRYGELEVGWAAALDSMPPPGDLPKFMMQQYRSPYQDEIDEKLRSAAVLLSECSKRNNYWGNRCKEDLRFLPGAAR